MTKIMMSTRQFKTARLSEANQNAIDRLNAGEAISDADVTDIRNNISMLLNQVQQSLLERNSHEHEVVLATTQMYLARVVASLEAYHFKGLRK